jgi:hypothetical protein
VVVVRLDATVIPAASTKDGAEPNFKGFLGEPGAARLEKVGVGVESS